MRRASIFLFVALVAGCPASRPSGDAGAITFDAPIDRDGDVVSCTPGASCTSVGASCTSGTSRCTCTAGAGFAWECSET